MEPCLEHCESFISSYCCSPWSALQSAPHHSSLISPSTWWPQLLDHKVCSKADREP